MLMNTANLKGLTIRAADGELGTVDEAYFDDDTWAIRYITVDTGGWLGGRSVLLSPLSISATDWHGRQLDVALTKQQVENSPNIDTHRPVSRQREAAYHGYYGFPYYWVSPGLGGAFYPSGDPTPETQYADEMTTMSQRESADSHLRSIDSLSGRNIEAADGEIGHVSGCVFDDEDWSIRYIEVATRNWWPGKKVLISPAWIKRMTWADRSVQVGLTRDAIKTGPEYIETMPVTRDYENQIYLHYGLPPYWKPDVRREALTS